MFVLLSTYMRLCGIEIQLNQYLYSEKRNHVRVYKVTIVEVSYYVHETLQDFVSTMWN